MLDNLPRGHRAIARGGAYAPFDLLVRGPDGTVLAWEVKGNELDERGPILERRRFSASMRQVEWVAQNRDRVRLCFLWLDAPRMRFGYRVVPAGQARWKSPASPKWVLPPQLPIPLRRRFDRYADEAEGRRLREAWEALPPAEEPPAPSGPLPA